jgi:hypothetical protein
MTTRGASRGLLNSLMAKAISCPLLLLPDPIDNVLRLPLRHDVSSKYVSVTTELAFYNVARSRFGPITIGTKWN